ncbi:transposable element Tcb2 transposase [Trichonephila clavipes]|nr:transposable element Tcb2 transposase [Trichonephila clavipes]
MPKMFPSIEESTDFDVRSVISVLNARNVKPVENHRRLVKVYGENVMVDEIKRNWKWPGSLESPRVSSPRFNNDSKMMVMRVDVTAQVATRVTTPNEDRYIYLAVTAKRNRRSTASDLSRQLSSAIGTTISRQTVYRRLGHIGLCARRPVRRVH